MKDTTRIDRYLSDSEKLEIRTCSFIISALFSSNHGFWTYLLWKIFEIPDLIQNNILQKNY